MAHVDFLKEHPEYTPILAFWAFREWYMNRSIEFDLLLKAYKDRIDDKQMPIAWVAIEDGIPVGMVSLKENDLWSRKDLNPWLGSLFVLPEYRNRDIGKILIDKAIERTKALNFKRLYLFTDAGNISIGNYYTKTGWFFLEKAIGNDENIVNIYFNNL